MGAENVSLVTPTHVVPYLVQAFEIYKPNIPVVYNSSGYEKVSTLKEIDGFVDIYLPDLKFYSSALSQRYLGKADYFEKATEAITFMSKKPLKMTADGKMLSGVIVRHLVMPLGVADSKSVLKWCKNTLPTDVKISLMSQYTPFGKVENFPELKRKITVREYNSVVDAAVELGLGERLFLQDLKASDQKYIPHWDF